MRVGEVVPPRRPQAFGSSLLAMPLGLSKRSQVAGEHGDAGGLGLLALVAIGIGGMVGGGIFSVLGLTVQVAGAGAYVSFVVGGVVAALTGFSYARLSVIVRSRAGTAAFWIVPSGPGSPGH